ncbi:hypothetical protein ACMAUO_12650 [Gluconacetobacter sp. Hr-1-5]|uniref:hypothetical protein n=1 Tax=Gluconacetobacter sp. Hr-1-5 TaxID=3395370 RepID=UPI003B5286CE
MSGPVFTRDGARFVVDQRYFGRFEYDAETEARSIVALEKALSDYLRRYGEYPNFRADVTDSLRVCRDDAALKFMEFLSTSVIGPGPSGIRQLTLLRRLMDELIVQILASIRPLPSKVKIEESGAVNTSMMEGAGMADNGHSRLPDGAA